MTDDKKEELIEVELAALPSYDYDDVENHWDEPQPYEWIAPPGQEEEYEPVEYVEVEMPPIRGLIIFQVDALDFHHSAEDVFRDKHATLIDRLAYQGIETMVVINKKHGGDLGVKVEYVHLGY